MYGTQWSRHASPILVDFLVEHNIYCDYACLEIFRFILSQRVSTTLWCVVLWHAIVSNLRCESRLTSCEVVIGAALGRTVAIVLYMYSEYWCLLYYLYSISIIRVLHRYKVSLSNLDSIERTTSTGRLRRVYYRYGMLRDQRRQRSYRAMRTAYCVLFDRGRLFSIPTGFSFIIVHSSLEYSIFSIIIRYA